MTTMFHGGRGVLHSGLCLTDDVEIAARYAAGRGEQVWAVVVDMDALTGRDASELLDRDNMVYPGDTAAHRAALIAEGQDYITFPDEDPNGNQHRTWRLLSPAALAAVVSITIEED